MPRKRPHYASSAARKFLRGTVHNSPHEAIEAGARTDEELAAYFEGQSAKFWATNGLKARRAVQSRHPMSHAETETAN